MKKAHVKLNEEKKKIGKRLRRKRDVNSLNSNERKTASKKKKTNTRRTEYVFCEKKLELFIIYV